MFHRSKDPRQAMFARGRMRTGEMNKTEAEYSRHLESLKATGAILWFVFEGIKFRLADRTFLTPDFAVLMPDGELHIKDVKGFMMEDANVKIKVAAEAFPMRFFLVRKRAKKDGGGWEETEV